MGNRRSVALTAAFGLAGAIGLSGVAGTSSAASLFTDSTRLTGAAEVPGPGDADALGSAYVTIDTATDEVCFRLQVRRMDPAHLAHIHVGNSTVAGPVVVNFTPPTNGFSSGCVIDSDADAIVANPSNYYVNVHNMMFPAGAVRGQLGG